MRKIPAYITVLALVFSSSCFYTPDEEIFTEVVTPNPVGTISLSNYDDGDTIFLFNAAKFDFNVGISEGSIKEVKVLLSGIGLYSGKGPAGAFSIMGSNLRTGIAHLQIEFISSSESGSLLDKLGGEFFKVWRKWVVKIDVDPPPLTVLEVVPNTNFLTFHWKPYLKANFVSYEIDAPKSGKHIVIDDPSITSWVDSSFVCGQASFTLKVNNILYSRSAEKIVNYPLDVQLAYTSHDSTALLKWKKIPFPGAFKHVEILENNNSRITISSPADSTLQLKLKHVIMGRPSILDFHLRSRHQTFPVFLHREVLDNPLGLEQLKNPTTMYYSLELNGLIGHDHTDNVLNVYDADLNIMSVDASVPGALYAPSSGPYVYFQTLTQAVRRHFSTKEQIAVGATKTSGATATISAVSGGGNGNVVFTYLDDASSSYLEHYTKVYNMNSLKLIHSSKLGNYPGSGHCPAPCISGDGSFFYKSDTRNIYAIEADTLRGIGTLPLNAVFAGFREDDNKQLFLSYPSSIDLCNTSDFSVLKSIPLPESGYVFRNYDPVTKSILLVKPGALKAYLIDVETGEVRTLPVYGDQYKFLNGILFDVQHHYYLRIN